MTLSIASWFLVAMLGASVVWLRVPRLQVLCYAALLLVTGWLTIANLGHPRPFWLGVPKAELLAYRVNEQAQVTYLWLQRPGDSSPIAITIPWSAIQVHKMEKAMAEGKAGDKKVMIQPKGYVSGQSVPMMVYPQPWPETPPKTERK